MAATVLEFTSPVWPAPPHRNPHRNPQRDLSIHDGDVLRQGEAALTMYLTPFVIGTEAVMRTLTVAAECAKANRLRFEMLP